VGCAVASLDRKTVTVLSPDIIQVGCEEAALRALDRLVEDVRLHEPETLTFQVHTAATGDRRLPPTDQRHVTILASYPDIEEFFRCADGASFAKFAAEHRQLFASAGGKPFAEFECLSTQAGFSRDAPAAGDLATPVAANRHPAVMFEISAKHQDGLKCFYQQVFGWQYRIGTGQFAYVDFSGNTPPLLGGIGQSLPHIPGFEPGHRFYLLVDELCPVIARAVSAGGTQQMAPTCVDGYHFAIILDPEDNPIGLITPFNN
jgi:predicted enzyme related to lactoylglutathione lyase